MVLLKVLWLLSKYAGQLLLFLVSSMLGLITFIWLDLKYPAQMRPFLRQTDEWLKHVTQDVPDRYGIWLDALASEGPVITLMLSLGWRALLGALAGLLATFVFSRRARRPPAEPGGRRGKSAGAAGR